MLIVFLDSSRFLILQLYTWLNKVKIKYAICVILRNAKIAKVQHLVWWEDLHCTGKQIFFIKDEYIERKNKDLGFQ